MNFFTCLPVISNTLTSDASSERINCDEVGLGKSDISVLISVLGEVGPLHFHPELEAQKQNQLDAYYQGADWNPNSGIPLTYPYDGILVNRGHRIPHHRTGKPISQRCVVAAMHYTILR